MIIHVISCDEAINEIAELLREADGAYVAKIYTDLSGNKKARYVGDSLISVATED